MELYPLALQSPVLPLRHLLAVSWKQSQINTAFVGLPKKKVFRHTKRHITVSSWNSLDFRDETTQGMGNFCVFEKLKGTSGTVYKNDEYATCLKHPAQIQLFFETSQLKLALLKRSSSIICCWRKAWFGPSNSVWTDGWAVVHDLLVTMSCSFFTSNGERVKPYCLLGHFGPR